MAHLMVICPNMPNIVQINIRYTHTHTRLCFDGTFELPIYNDYICRRADHATRRYKIYKLRFEHMHTFVYQESKHVLHTVVVVVLASIVGRFGVHVVKFVLSTKSGWVEDFKMVIQLRHVFAG